MTDNVEVGGVDKDRLRSYVERIESVTSEIKELQEDVKGIYLESKSAGFDNKAIRAIIKLRSLTKFDRDQQESILDLYKRALDL